MKGYLPLKLQVLYYPIFTGAKCSVFNFPTSPHTPEEASDAALNREGACSPSKEDSANWKRARARARARSLNPRCHSFEDEAGGRFYVRNARWPRDRTDMSRWTRNLDPAASISRIMIGVGQSRVVPKDTHTRQMVDHRDAPVDGPRVGTPQ
jgi:hypothetical protein